MDQDSLAEDTYIYHPILMVEYLYLRSACNQVLSKIPTGPHCRAVKVWLSQVAPSGPANSQHFAAFCNTPSASVALHPWPEVQRPVVLLVVLLVPGRGEPADPGPRYTKINEICYDSRRILQETLFYHPKMQKSSRGYDGL